MKLVIEIPDNVYKNCCKVPLNPVERAIKNGKPYETVIEFADRCKECGREKVLNKIRAEIEAIIGEYNSDDYDFCSGLICARKIIDKYKEESEE